MMSKFVNEDEVRLCYFDKAVDALKNNDQRKAISELHKAMAILEYVEETECNG